MYDILCRIEVGDSQIRVSNRKILEGYFRGLEIYASRKGIPYAWFPPFEDEGQGVTVFERHSARGANATDGADGERQLASIREARSIFVGRFTELHQIAIEGAVVERSQFHLDHRSPRVARREESKRIRRVFVVRPSLFLDGTHVNHTPR